VRERLVNRKVNPKLYSLPSWVVDYRAEQVKAIGEIVEAFNEVDLVVLDAPTGSGKTLIAETVRRILGVRALYVCHSLGLQDQFVKDFDYARAVKGRSNYPTGLLRDSFPTVSCADCQWTVDIPRCSLCVDKKLCPYERAKSAALGADVAVVNAAYALTEWNGPSRFAGRGLTVIDEADVFEPAINSYISVELTERRMRRLGWHPPSKVTVKSSWMEWFDEYLPKVKAMVEAAPDEEKRRLVRLGEQMSKVRDGLDAGLPYAFTGRLGAVAFKPVLVDDFTVDSVWRHGSKWLLMSASIVSPDATLRGLGWKGDRVTVSMPSTFPIKNRLVRIRPIANMSRHGKDFDFGKLEEAIRKLTDSEAGRTVIHTVSYSLARDIHRSLSDYYRARGRLVVTYALAGERAAALSQYIRTPGSILVAPSADRGVDLPDDLCRLQIIAKVPFPNLGDRMVSMRLHMDGGQTWYTAETIRTIVQMAGRGVRHKDDYCQTMILDSQFASVWARGKGLFPRWFKEAIVWENPQRP